MSELRRRYIGSGLEMYRPAGPFEVDGIVYEPPFFSPGLMVSIKDDRRLTYTVALADEPRRLR